MKLFLIVVSMLIASANAFAQVLDDVIYTVGTTTQDAAARNWGYIVWQGSSPDLVQNKRFAIYSKTGDAAALNPFTRQAIVGVQTEPAVIQVILNRSVNLGESLEQLDSRIVNLFQKLMPPGSASLAEKVSIVIRGSLNDPGYFNNLIMLARLHPSISQCLGMAHAAIIPPGVTTFEVREFDFGKGVDLGVVGRVTVQSGVVVELPAPGAPVALPEPSAKGNLNVTMRWSTPDELRRLALLSYGFNIYRMTKAYAESKGFHAVPPSAAQLLSALANPAAVQLNRMPVLKNRDYTAATVSNFGIDGTNSFFADDNRRYEPGGVAFGNGDQFYYFVAARDVLGRIGKPSQGSLITICDKLPPNAPTGLTVKNEYTFIAGASKQVLKVRWKQDAQTNDTVKAYYVYRWLNPDEVQVHAGNPASHRIAGPILHVNGQEFNSYVDDGAGSPSVPADVNKTFWYTIRSEDTSACGGNLSANSGPAFGVLRDRVGPDAPGGYVEFICRRPVVEPGRQTSGSDRDPQDQAFAYFNLVCDRRDAGIVWAEFFVFDYNMASNYLGRATFDNEKQQAVIRAAIPREAFVNQRTPVFFCRVGSANGKISNYAIQTIDGVPKPSEIRNIFFDAYTLAEKIRQSPTGKPDCSRHDPVGPGSGGNPTDVTPTIIVVTLTPTTKEYKLYRRIDFGALTLIKQGPVDFNDVSQIQIPDEAMPPNAGSICYYAQVFDEHGNPSPLTLVGGECLVVSGTTPLPAAMLAPLEVAGTEASPRLNIKWFCPPFGVERFLIHVSVDPAPAQVSINDALSDYLSATPTTETYTQLGAAHTNKFWTYRTPRVGPGFGNGAQFEIEARVIQGKKYVVYIQAVGKDGNIGPRSNFEDGQWSPIILTGPRVPWPARPLPPFNIFNAGMLAEQPPASVYEGLGVRIGSIFSRLVIKGDKGQPTAITSNVDPMAFTFTNSLGESLFPAAMYRIQTASAEFPTVPGDVVQVTPLMENIAYSRATNASGAVFVQIQDPFIRVGNATFGNNDPDAPIYLVDTQPVIERARYVYLLVRFDENHEIKEVVPSSVVEVTP
jgi:hypothetical protein